MVVVIIKNHYKTVREAQHDRELEKCRLMIAAMDRHELPRFYANSCMNLSKVKSPTKNDHERTRSCTTICLHGYYICRRYYLAYCLHSFNNI